tara:strand:+ start:130 stop:588 length:459 start_codon:yes stop_codon:yes gene_type:complete
MNMKLAKQVATLIAEKRGLEDSLRAVKDDIAKLEPELLNMLMEEQMDRLHITVGDEKVTLYIHKILWAKPKDGDRQAVIDTLVRCGLSEFVQENYNSNSLSAYVRERLANGQQLQPTLADAVSLEEVVSIRGRRSPATSESTTAKAMKTIRR